MKISLFFLLDHYPEDGTGVGARLHEVVERCVRAEALGYDGLWFAEHHFRDFGVMPNPAVLLAAVAARTRSIRLGPAVAVLPFRHPLQVAEDYLIVDQLSRGRLDLGVGSGTISWEFQGFGADIQQKSERFAEALEALRPLLRGETIQRSAPGFAVDGRSNVPPFRAGGPRVYVASNRAEHARLAGSHGDGLLTMLSPDCEGLHVLDERLAQYRRGAAETGAAPTAGGAPGGDVAVAIMAHVGATDDGAREAVRPAMLRFLESHAGVDGEQATAIYQGMLDRGTGLFGSAESVRAGLQGLIDRGVSHAVLWMDLGGIDRDALDASLDRLARDVRPRLRPGKGVGFPTSRS